MKLVLDASAILSGVDPPLAEELLMPPLVEKELGHAWARRKLAYLKEVRLRVVQPSTASMETVRRATEGTGDDARLSGADMQVLALALETGATILTDDYSIQNLAEILGIPYRPVVQKGIREVLKWGYRCTGCKRELGKKAPECPVCGAPVRSFRKASGRQNRV
ncbi:MAG: nucleic acid-binding protein [Thermoplasmata archaeon]